MTLLQHAESPGIELRKRRTRNDLHVGVSLLFGRLLYRLGWQATAYGTRLIHRATHKERP